MLNSNIIILCILFYCLRGFQQCIVFVDWLFGSYSYFIMKNVQLYEISVRESTWELHFWNSYTNRRRIFQFDFLHPSRRMQYWIPCFFMRLFNFFKQNNQIINFFAKFKDGVNTVSNQFLTRILILYLKISKKVILIFF